MMTTSYLTPVELVYRKLSQPSPPEPARVVQEFTRQPELTREEVDAIIQRKRSATPEQLQAIIDLAQHYKLSTWERNQLGVDTGIALAARAHGKPDLDSLFIHEVLDYADTPFGLLANRSFFEREYRRGAEAISCCRNHRPPRCGCWVAQRQMLWHVQNVYGGRSPEGYAAGKIWSALDDLEGVARPERGQ
jgi:hypothetical protein